MSDETSDEKPEEKPAKKAAARRVPGRKAAKKAKPEEPQAQAAEPTYAAAETGTEPMKVTRISSKPGDSPKPEGGEGKEGASEETIPVITEPPGDEVSGGGKRRRRRRRKSGGDDGDAVDSPAKRPSLDPRAVASKAWKIYKAEVGEEGLALINDNDARELTRRSFRLAEIFLEEAARRQ